MKRLTLLILLSAARLPANELEKLQTGFLESHKTPEAVGMAWDAATPEQSPDWFRVSEAGVTTLPMIGKGFRFSVVELKVGDHSILGLVDTGAGTSLISLEAAMRIGAHPIGPRIDVQKVMGFGGGGVGVKTRIPTLSLGDLEVENIRCLVFPQTAGLAMLPEVEGQKIEMLVGYDLLQAFDWVEFHSAKQFICIGVGKPFEGNPRVSEDLVIGPKKGPQVSVSVNGSALFPVTLDTGGTFGLRLPQKQADRLGIRRKDFITLPQERKSSTGTSATVKGEKVNLSIGQAEMRNLPTYINLGHDAAAERIGALIGNPVLSRVHWVLDHKNKKILFFL